MRLLELFAGSRSVGSIADVRGWQVFSLDIQPFEKIDLVKDILEVTKQDLPFIPDVIWASPDCTTFSIAAISTHRNGTEAKSEKAKNGDAMLAKTIEIISWFPNAKFFIENPMGMMRKLFEMRSLHRDTVTYCQYADEKIQRIILNMTEKKCPKCGEIKLIDQFYKSSSRASGFTSHCKECSNAQHAKYVAENAEKMREYGKDRYYKNHETILANRRESNKRNKESIRRKAKEYYQNNKELVAQRAKEYHQQNKEQRNAQCRERYQSNPTEYKLRATERKALKRTTSDGTITQDALDQMLHKQNYVCGYCKADLRVVIKHLDHIVPISKEGTHSLNNVQWICADCNLSKKDLLEEEWLIREGRMKPTDLWHNTNWVPRPMCKNGDPCHEAAPRGSRTGTQGIKGSYDRSRIPLDLVKEVLDSI